MQIASSFFGERAQVIDDLIGIDQKIPDYLIKIRFLVKVETLIR